MKGAKKLCCFRSTVYYSPFEQFGDGFGQLDQGGGLACVNTFGK